MLVNAVTHDVARNASANRKYTVSPVVDTPRALNLADWTKVTALPTTADGNLHRETVTVEYKRFDRTPMHDASRTRTFTSMVTNSPRQKPARRSGKATNYYTPKGI